ncbi:MAG: hypothetical protein GVY18_15040 [Bacteroidetes bacterium]|nr:hypothetical protein [Bacteroidota bacterium]
MTASAQQSVPLQYFRPIDQRGIDVFEPTKQDSVGYDGFELYWGAAFTQQFQGLTQSNEADPVMEDGVDVNALPELGAGFNLATANLYLGAQLADGIRVNLTTYLSSRHHPEAWVKGGYIQVDKLPMIQSQALDNLMEVITLKVGHFEINYGDGHFRRSDNGNALYNPFVGNYIVDAFTTEIGGEVYVQKNGLLGMVGITGGEIRGAVTRPDDRAPSFYGKVGIDRQINDALRVRLTGSAYTTSASLNNTLHSGDRAGSRYYDVIGGGDWSGRVRDGIRNEKTAFMVNPFVQFAGVEVFGLLEWAEGNSSDGAPTRSWNQYAVEVLYRFLDDDVYVGGRYNVADGELFTNDVEVSVDRIQIGGGWFATPNLLVKAEYIQQNYNDYPSANLFHEGTFDGFMIEGVLTF